MAPASTAAKTTDNRRADVSSGLLRGIETRRLFWCLVLAAAVLVTYNSVVHNGFLNYDDEGSIVQNAHLKAGLWAAVKWAFTTFDSSNWYPLTWLSHALDYQLFGLNPAGHHYTNVLLHALNAILLFLLLRSATGCNWRGLMVAALFALHPVNVESVVWAVERKNVLSMLFFLLALCAYTWYARQTSLRRYAAMVFLFALATMAKPQVVTFPFLLLLWDYWPLGRIAATSAEGPDRQNAVAGKTGLGWLILEKVPLLALAAASSFLTLKAQSADGTVKSLSLYSLPLRLETAVVAYVRYIGKALWPSRLAALYPHPTRLYPIAQIAASVTVLLVVTVCVLCARRRRYLAVGWFWFLGSLVPMIGLVQVGAQAMADRYAYIPFIGLFVMATWFVAELAGDHRLSATWLAVPAVVWLLVLAALTHRQVAYWHDTETFWTHTIAVTEDNFLAHDILGYYLQQQGRTEEAIAHYRAAVTIRPEDAQANMNLGPYEQARGHFPEAIDHYQRLAMFSADPGLRATAYFNLGHVYRQVGDLARAKQCFEMTLQIAPDEPTAMVGLGLIAEASGDAGEAARQFTQALSKKSTDVGWLLLAHALEQQGRTGEANSIVERVVHSSPNFAQAQKTAAALLAGH